MRGSAKHLLANIGLALGLAAMITPTWAETADDLAKQYKKESMEQALEAKQRFDLYGLRFSQIRRRSKPAQKIFLMTLRRR